MAISPDTLPGVVVDIERFRVSDEVVLEVLCRQNQSPVLRDGLITEIRGAEARVDKALLNKGIQGSDYFVVQLGGVLQMCSAITVCRIYRELGWGEARYVGLPGYGQCILLAKKGVDVTGNNVKLISDATRDGVMLTLEG